MDETADFLVEQFPRTRRTLRIAVVTETYPPEVNGVALSAARFVDGLRQRDHQLNLVIPLSKAVDESGGAQRYAVDLRRICLRHHRDAQRAACARELFDQEIRSLVHFARIVPAGCDGAMTTGLRFRVTLTTVASPSSNHSDCVAIPS